MKVDARLKRCGCRSVGECTHNLTAELDALERLSKTFGKEMFNKMRKKFFEGYHGWNNEKFPTYLLRRKLKEHLKKGDMVDIGILAAFIWNREK